MSDDKLMSQDKLMSDDKEWTEKIRGEFIDWYKEQKDIFAINHHVEERYFQIYLARARIDKAEIERLKISEELLCDNIDNKDKEIEKREKLLLTAFKYMNSVGYITSYNAEDFKKIEKWLADLEELKK